MNNNNPKPLVSVVIPVYNGTKFLKEAIESILASTYSNLEIILVDDGSTDLSREKCLSFTKDYSNISFYGFKQNRGMSHCLNHGIKMARGKYIARLNQDDLIIKDRLEKQLNYLESNLDCVAVGGAIQLFTSKKSNYDQIFFPLTDEEIRAQWLLVSPFSDPSVMFRKASWQKTTGYEQNFWPADDVQMWYQLGALGKLANLPDIVTLVRWHKAAGSLAIHRLQIFKTWCVHHWAKQQVVKPSLLEQLFWLGQLTAGMLFPAQFNWFIYRWLRKLNFFQKNETANHGQSTQQTAKAC